MSNTRSIKALIDEKDAKLYLKYLPKIEQEMLTLYYGFFQNRPHTIAEISQIFKIAKSTALRHIDNATNQVYEMVKNQGPLVKPQKFVDISLKDFEKGIGYFTGLEKEILTLYYQLKPQNIKTFIPYLSKKYQLSKLSSLLKQYINAFQTLINMDILEDNPLTSQILFLNKYIPQAITYLLKQDIPESNKVLTNYIAKSNTHRSLDYAARKLNITVKEAVSLLYAYEPFIKEIIWRVKISQELLEVKETLNLADFLILELYFKEFKEPEVIAQVLNLEENYILDVITNYVKELPNNNLRR